MIPTVQQVPPCVVKNAMLLGCRGIFVLQTFLILVIDTSIPIYCFYFSVNLINYLMTWDHHCYFLPFQEYSKIIRSFYLSPLPRTYVNSKTTYRNMPSSCRGEPMYIHKIDICCVIKSSRPKRSNLQLYQLILFH